MRHVVIAMTRFYDLLFAYAKFEGPLPPTLREWKAAVRALFPGGIYDTKRIAHAIGVGERSSGGNGAATASASRERPLPAIQSSMLSEVSNDVLS